MPRNPQCHAWPALLYRTNEICPRSPFLFNFWKKDLFALFPLKSYEVEYWYPASYSEAKELASISSAKREDSAGNSVRLG